MISEIKKNLVSLETGVILHGCNCVGGFGSGVAGAIRRTWPIVYKEFMEAGIGDALLGTSHVVAITNKPFLVVINGYTQLRYGNDGHRYADLGSVEKCVRYAVNYCKHYEQDLYMPMIGCGLGGLSWEDEVKPIIEKVSSEYSDVNIFICDL